MPTLPFLMQLSPIERVYLDALVTKPRYGPEHCRWLNTEQYPLFEATSYTYSSVLDTWMEWPIEARVTLLGDVYPLSEDEQVSI
ncbi:hypothetical protein F2Q68_00044697 [Brassica cretica]|uniref:Uncharacterized protein n=1 Tax=Brassica cretica TaxID=69181 RepID=A0A8S9LM07_BRACR|nr:hypothetical protein F2Q68_00044697 [Brassica cretica]